jgi:hypothetical protein
MILPDGLFANATKVLTLFLIPIGGGIPAGVILAKSFSFHWYLTALLYFLSDLILAVAFEPLMHGFIRLAKHSKFLTMWIESYKISLSKTGFKLGLAVKPFSLIMLSFGVDPMTGRAAAKAAGHGFLSGWTLAICGDMIFFALIMSSTLLLDNILGDGTMAAVIIMVAMIGVPILIDRWKSRA